ncbi:MAG: hypothetical protein IJH18_02615 [Bacilli bacterium]|nr:hypothetical protein [Bacilli bacterium]
MLDEVYDYLYNYGFNALDLDNFEKRNQGIFYLEYNDVRRIIKFLEEKGLEPDEIINVIVSNPFLLTESTKKIEQLEEICGNIGFGYDDLKDMIIRNPKMYSASPDEIGRIVEYLKMQNTEDKEIRKIFFENPKILNMKFDDFQKAMLGG